MCYIVYIGINTHREKKHKTEKNFRTAELEYWGNIIHFKIISCVRWGAINVRLR